MVTASRWSKVQAVNGGYQNELREVSIWIRTDGKGKECLPPFKISLKKKFAPAYGRLGASIRLTLELWKAQPKNHKEPWPSDQRDLDLPSYLIFKTINQYILHFRSALPKNTLQKWAFSTDKSSKDKGVWVRWIQAGETK